MRKLSLFFNASSRRITIGLGFIKITKVLASILVVILSAKYFGTSEERDAWVLGGTIVSVTVQLIFGPINETFRVKYIHLREEESKEIVNEHSFHLISLITIVCVVISVAVFCWPDIITHLFAPGFSVSQNIVLTKMIKILIPSLIVMQLVNIWGSMLNAYGSFFIPDIFSFISVVLNIILIVFLSPFIGIYSLVLSSYISSLLLLIFIYRELKIKFYYKFKVVFPKKTMFGPFLIFALPFYINYIFSQSDTIVEKALISNMMQGSVSIIDYAKRFSDMSLAMIMSLITTVLTPILAYAHSKHGEEVLIDETQKYFRMMTLIILPLVIIFIVLPNEIVTVLLARGAFSSKNIPITADLLRMYSFGILFSSIYIIYSQVLIAKKKIYVFSIILISLYIVKMLLNYLFYKQFGLIIFPVSWGITYFLLGTIFMFLATIGHWKEVLTDAMKVYLIFVISLSITYISYRYLAENFSSMVRFLFFGVEVILIEILLILLFQIKGYADFLTKIKSNLIR